MSATHDCFLALGSNIDPNTNLVAAMRALGSMPGSVIYKQSSYYQTTPLGKIIQPDFINAVVWLKTILDPWEVLSYTQRIELIQHRNRLIHWGPRTIDIDLLCYDHLKIKTTELTLPHYAAHLRNFVIIPWYEIAPDWSCPPINLAYLYQKCSKKDIQKIHNIL